MKSPHSENVCKVKYLTLPTLGFTLRLYNVIHGLLAQALEKFFGQATESLQSLLLDIDMVLWILINR